MRRYNLSVFKDTFADGSAQYTSDQYDETLGSADHLGSAPPCVRSIATWGLVAMCTALAGCPNEASSQAGDAQVDGVDSATEAATDVSDVEDVPVDPNAIVEISAGDGHTCARRASGQVVCWGVWAQVQLPPSSPDAGVDAIPRMLLPSVITTIRDATQIAAGHMVTCALQRDGDPVCWGASDLRTGMELHPVHGLIRPVQLSLRDFGGCAIQADGQVACWSGNFIAETIAHEVPGITDAVEVVADSAFTCVRRRNGQVVCWGTNALGELGDGTMTSRDHPTDPVVGVNDAIGIAIGGTNACALRAGGAVVCWGDALLTLDDGGFGNTLTPVEIVGLEDVLELSSGGGQSYCARRRNGRVLCWGRALLGDGSYLRQPVEVEGITDAIAISVGSSHACALRRDRHVLCWGSDFRGQLGDGRIVDVRLIPPVEVQGL